MIWRLGIFLTLCCCSPISLGATQLAIIIDDIGYNGALGRRATDLEGAFTLAVLPFTPHTRELAERGHRQGKEIMLHIPMSNTRDIPLGKGGLIGDMSHADFMATLRASLADIPHLSGVNNHMGSQLTREPEPMGWVMDELAARQLYFIDSRTSADSQAFAVAQAYGVPSLKRDVFLDNERREKAIQRQLLKALQLAQHRGNAIAIGHPYPETLNVLAQLQPLLTAHDVELVPISHLLRTHSRFITKIGTSCLAPPQKLWMQPSASPEPVTMETLMEGVLDFGYQ